MIVDGRSRMLAPDNEQSTGCKNERLLDATPQGELLRLPPCDDGSSQQSVCSALCQCCPILGTAGYPLRSETSETMEMRSGTSVPKRATTPDQTALAGLPDRAGSTS